MKDFVNGFALCFCNFALWLAWMRAEFDSRWPSWFFESLSDAFISESMYYTLRTKFS